MAARRRTPEDIIRGTMIGMIRQGELAELSDLASRHPIINVNALLARYGGEGVGVGSTGIPERFLGSSRDVLPPFVNRREVGVGPDIPIIMATRDIGVGPDLPMADAFGDPTAVGGLGGAGGSTGGNEYMDFLKKVYNVKETNENDNPEDLQLIAQFQKKLGLEPRGLYKTPVTMRQASQINQFMGGSRNPCDDYLKL